MIDRYFKTFTEHLQNEFAHINTNGKQLTTQSLLESLVGPMLRLNEIRPDGAATFMRLLGRAYTESQGHLKIFLSKKYEHLLTQFTALVHIANPKLNDSDMFWRLHFMLGTLVFALAGHQALSEIAEADLNETVDTEGILRRLIPFLSAAMQPSITENQE